MLVRQRIELDLNVVLALQAEHEDVELQRADHADDDLLHARVVLLEDLDRAFLRDLRHALHELLALHGVNLADPRKMLRRKRRNALVFEFFIRRAQRVTDGEDARVEQADDVARVRLLDDVTLVRHHLRRLGELDLAAALHVVDLHARYILARADAQKRDAVAVRLVHVGLDLEHKPRKILSERVNHALVRLPRQRGGRHPQKVLQERLNTEVGERGTEEDGRQLAGVDKLLVELCVGAVEKLYVLEQLVVEFPADALLERRIVDAHVLGCHFLLTVHRGREQRHLAGLTVVHALEAFAAADGPVDRARRDAEHIFNVAHELVRIVRLAVHLVDEREDRNVAHDANLEELDRLALHTLAGVDDHHGGVRSHQRAVRILREILVTRRVQYVDAVIVVVELQNRRGHTDASLLLDLHPVRHRVPGRLASLHRSRQVDRAAVQQELLRQSRLTGIGVRDDRKRSALLYVVVQ